MPLHKSKLPGSALRAARDRRQLEYLTFQKNGCEGAGVEQTLHHHDKLGGRQLDLGAPSNIQG